MYKDLIISGAARVRKDATGVTIGVIGTDGKDLLDGLGVGKPLRRNRLVKQFTDLLGVTITANSATYTASIDMNSPYGCPALKLNITFTANGGRVEVSPPPMNIPSFSSQIGYSVWIDDATKIGQIGVFAGTAGYAKYQQANHLLFSGGDLIAGPRVIFAGPIRKNSVTDGGFVFGSDPLQASKLRISSGNPYGSATIWIKDCFIAAPQRPIICFTWDDGFDSWVNKVHPILNSNGVKGTFSINTDQIDKAQGITTANINALKSGGHHIACHNIYNYKLQSLFGTGNGEQNGSGASQDAQAYASDYLTGRATLEGFGIDPQDFMFHPWVQGGMDMAVADWLYSSGCDLIRTTAPYEAQMYGYDLGNNALAVRAINLDITRSLAQATAMIDDAITYGGMVMFMGHQTNDSTADGVTWLTSDLAALVEYAASKRDAGVADIMTAREMRDRFQRLGILRNRNAAVPTQPVRCIGRLSGALGATASSANLNITTDQQINLPAGTWKIESVLITKSSANLSASSVSGGVYTAASKGGTVIAANQSLSGMTTSTDVVSLTMSAVPSVSGSVFLSLTTAHGSAATADVFVFGRPV